MAAAVQELGTSNEPINSNEVPGLDHFADPGSSFHHDTVEDEIPNPAITPPPTMSRHVSLHPRDHIDRLPPPPPQAQPAGPPAESETNHPHQGPNIPGQKTASNSYGVYRVYKSRLPSFSPNEHFRVSAVADSPNFVQPPPSHQFDPTDFTPFRQTDSNTEVPPSAFPNQTVFRVMGWHYLSLATKSIQDLNSLVHDVIRAEDFKIDELADFDAAKELKRLDAYASNNQNLLKDGWIEASVPIALPREKVKHQSEDAAPVYDVPGLLYQKPLEVIKAAFQEENAQEFHLSPFEEYWKSSPASPPERIYSELYNSNAFINEHEKLQSSPGVDVDQLEAVIVPIMLWSDSTHLTNFGSASLWPIYLYLGSQSKYTCGKPSAFAAHHLAYMPKLDDIVEDMYKAEYGKAPSSDMMTHLKRELIQYGVS